MLTPTIHLNGSSPETLQQQFHACVRACSALLDAIHEAAPNGRDYYPQGATAFTQACQEHQEHVYRVQALLEEYTGLYEYVIEARNARSRPA